MNWLRCTGPQRTSQQLPDLRMLESSVQIRIKGWNADLAYSLTYKNFGSETQRDVKFVFPVDDCSAVYRLVAELNGRTIECECREKSEAKAAYNAAVSMGHSAAFVAESDSSADLMECYLGNVAAGGLVKINVSSVVQLETPKTGELCLTIPRVLVPRYEPVASSDKAETATVAVATLVSSAEQSWLKGLRLWGSVRGLPNLKNMRCNQGVLSWKPDQAEFEVTQLNNNCDIELIVEFEHPTSGLFIVREAGVNESSSSLFRHEVAELTAFFEETAQTKTKNSKVTEFVIVVDRSGSMSGSNIQSAKEALLLFLKSLPSDCRFNIVSFGSSFTQLFEKSRSYSEQSLSKALRLQSTMQADMGGTEILPALRQVYETSDSSCQLRVIVLTDGEVGNVEEVKDFVVSKCRGSSHRLFAIGIGHGASTALVKGIARAGGGRADFVRDGAAEQLRSTVIGQPKAAQTAVVENLQLTASTTHGKAVVIGTVPTDPLSSGQGLVSQSRISMFVLLSPETSAETVTVTASFSVSGREVTVQCQQPATSATHSTEEKLLHRAAARTQLKEWSDSNSGGKHTRNIVELSLAANLTSAHTAFVGIDRETRQPVSEVALAPDESEEEICLSGLYKASSRGARLGNMQYATQGLASALPMAPTLACCAAPASAGSTARCAEKKSKKGGGILSRLFGRSSSAKLRSKETANIKYTACDSDCYTAFEEFYSEADEDYGKYKETYTDFEDSTPYTASNADPILQIASAQRFDGHWEASDEIAKILGMSVDQMKSTAPDSVALAVWVTALVCSHLEVKLQTQRNQWELMVDKAVAYIRAACPNADEILSAAKLLIHQA